MKPFLKIPASKTDSDAVFWHGNRYSVSEVLCKHWVEDEDAGDGSGHFVFERESEAWVLGEALDNEGPLSCLDPNCELAERLRNLEIV